MMTNTLGLDRRQLETLKLQRFSGTLEVRHTTAVWEFYFYLGRLVFASGGPQGQRNWQRHLLRHGLRPDQGLRGGLEQYQTLCNRFQWGGLGREQAVSIIQGLVLEALFDLQALDGLQYRLVVRALENPETLLTLLNVSEVLTQAEQEWQQWQRAGLIFAPHQALTLIGPEVFQKRLSPPTYRNLAHLLSGEWNLREVAQRVNLDVLALGQFLLPYVQEGLLKPLATQDAPRALAPLIACVDDSPQMCRLLGEVTTQAGYRYLAIQDPLQGFSTLLQTKPDLLFLDIVLPGTNGYEVCSRLRQVAHFRKTPIVMLSGNLIDQIRARLVGAVAALPKPIRPEAILAITRKHLKPT
ncbi:response regulator [Candidatus Cyanaurora vandensis]|uniref:response regulator n=1 Tax=Candidatus Cyanaurora vandensis TaxID=2714958 RepID=UPI00257B90BC|nr:response regulator [Candidatus Cyanaurora vandensis]